MREAGIDWRAVRRLLAAGFAAHLLLAALATRLPPLADSLVFQHWANRLAVVGTEHAYTGFPNPDGRYDYPPVYAYLSGSIGDFYRASGLLERFGQPSPVLRLLLQVPMILLHVATAGVLLRALSALPAPGVAPIAVAGAWLANPAIALATDVFVYQDALHTLLLVAAAERLLAGRDAVAGALLALAALTKPQAWPFVVPFAAYALGRSGSRGVARGAAGAGLASLAVLAPFAAAGQLRPLLRALVAIPSLEPFMTALAHNVWWLVFPVPEWDGLLHDLEPVLLGVSPFAIGLTLVLAAATLVAWHLWRRPTASGLVGLAAWLAFVFFMLATQIHENHLYAMFPFLTLAAAGSRFLRWVLLLLSVSFGANLVLANAWLQSGPVLLGPFWPSVANAGLNVAVLVVWSAWLLTGTRARPAGAGASV